MLLTRSRATLVALLIPAALTAQSSPISSAGDLAAKVRAELAAARALPPALDRVVTPVIDQIWDGFDRQAAIGQVQFMDQYWRLAGNEGFDKSIDRVKARLVSAGFTELSERPKGPITVPSLWMEPAPTPSLGWDQQVATVAIVRDGQPEQIVLSRERERLALAINSFSTAPGGVTVPLIDVGTGGSATDYANKDVKGAVVIGTAGTGQLYTQAVVNRGALGVISTAKSPAYLDPSPDLLQWGSITYDETRKPFGFRATPRAAATFRAATDAGPVKVRVEVATTFARKPERTLSAEIPGAVAPDERIVIAAHVQEPGANDNASGTATNMELARSLVTGVLSGRIAKPGRTLTFLWVNEISGSRRWLSEHPDQKAGVRYMFSMDMTGEDITQTGGHFLVERWPDPGAVWERPWDPHSEWGAGRVDVNSLKGDLINDLHLAMCERVAVKSLGSTHRPWDVRSNPYEGGSDHTQFGAAGIPSVLDWHFTDRFYHTNRDTAEKTSPDEMRNVGTAVAASAWLMASATEPVVAAVRELVTRAGDARVKVELRESATARAGVKPEDNEKIVAAWRTWYDEAIASVGRLLVAKPARAAAQSSTLCDPAAPPLPVSAINALWAADSRLLCPNERDLLFSTGLRAPSADARRATVLSLGRLESAETIPVVLPMLKDPSPLVRAEAANALAQTARTPADAVTIANAIALQLYRPQSLQKTWGSDGLVFYRVPPGHPIEHDAVAADMLAAIGRLPFTPAQAPIVAQLLHGCLIDLQCLPPDTGTAIDFRVSSVRILGSMRGFESLSRKTPRADYAAALLDLRRLVANGRADFTRAVNASDNTLAVRELRAQLRRLALQTLTNVADRDPDTILGAARDGDWQARRLATMMLGGLPLDGATADSTAVTMLEQRLKDESFQVRIEAVKIAARVATRTGDCTALLSATHDDAALVAMQALDGLPATCTDARPVVERLTALTEPLVGGSPSMSWHVGARALNALARLAPAQAALFVARPAVHGSGTWQLRASVATAAARVKDERVLLTLAGDRVPNVRVAAIDGLKAIGSAQLFRVAIDALASDDFQLVRAAAVSLRGAPKSDATAEALVSALTRLTDGGKDTSRDPRLAVIERLTEQEPVSMLPLIQAHLSDFDPQVAEAVRVLCNRLVPGAAFAATPKLRRPAQPTLADVQHLPRVATIVMQGGDRIELMLLVNEAPLSVARFASLARAGYYDGLTFHRIVPNFLVQGGSPGASEYVGDARYMSDEVGRMPNLRGSVGISTRGRDTGDAQIFFDLIDLPRLDHDYTVFAQITSGLEIVDRILEGDQITRVTIK